MRADGDVAPLVPLLDCPAASHGVVHFANENVHRKTHFIIQLWRGDLHMRRVQALK